MQHAWYWFEGYFVVVSRRVEILNFSDYLHISDLFNFLIFNEFLYNVSWIIFFAYFMLSPCVQEFLRQGPLIDWNLISATDQVLSVFQHMDKRLDSKAVIRHLACPQVHLLYVIDKGRVILEPQNDPWELYIIIFNEVLGIGHWPIEVNISEKLCSEHRIIRLFFIGITWWENWGHHSIDTRFLRIKFFR